MVQPRASIGAEIVTVQNINTIAGIGQNTGGARNLLLDLTGSLSNAFQDREFSRRGESYLPARADAVSQLEPARIQLVFQGRNQAEAQSHAEPGRPLRVVCGAPERQGKALAPVGGAAGLFGISGTSFADMFNPSRASGALTQIQLVGPGTPNPGVSLYNRDNNNFAPGVGFAWSLPWFGKNKTVFRAGYGMGFERNPILPDSQCIGSRAGPVADRDPAGRLQPERRQPAAAGGAGGTAAFADLTNRSDSTASPPSTRTCEIPTSRTGTSR